MKKFGIDVSHHQGDINWQSVKSGGAEFAIIRAGYGRLITQKDLKLEQNYAGCRKNGIDCGAYWYSYAKTPEEAEKEADVCLKAIEGKRFEYPIYFDIEEKSQYELGTAKCNAIIKTFCDKLEAAGYWVGIYSFKSFLENRVSEDLRKRYAVWVAHTGVGKTDYKGDYGIHQYSHTGRINGINGAVDMNYCFVDYPYFMKRSRLNGYDGRTENKSEIIEYKVKKGDTLWGIAAEYLGYGMRYEEIKELNALKSDIIYAGQILRIKKAS